MVSQGNAGTVVEDLETETPLVGTVNPPMTVGELDPNKVERKGRKAPYNMRHDPYGKWPHDEKRAFIAVITRVGLGDTAEEIGSSNEWGNLYEQWKSCLIQSMTIYSVRKTKLKNCRL